MKVNIKLFVIILLVVLCPQVYADTCSSKEQITLNNDISNIKINTQVNDNSIDIVIYNMTDNLKITYQDENNNERTISYSDTDNGKYVLSRNKTNVEQYTFKIRSTISACYDNVLLTKTIVKPKYNKYSELKICKNENLKNHTYCKEYINQDINKTQSEVEKTLKDYLSVKVKVQTTTKQQDKFNLFTVRNISIAGIVLGIAILISIVALVNKKRGEL